MTGAAIDMGYNPAEGEAVIGSVSEAACHSDTAKDDKRRYRTKSLLPGEPFIPRFQARLIFALTVNGSSLWSDERKCPGLGLQRLHGARAF
jgi:hypothetical protein